jgi:hypothetical protein
VERGSHGRGFAYSGNAHSGDLQKTLPEDYTKETISAILAGPPSELGLHGLG